MLLEKSPSNLLVVKPYEFPIRYHIVGNFIWNLILKISNFQFNFENKIPNF